MKLLNVIYDHKIEIGSCVIQCFELLCRYYGQRMNSYTIWGLSEVFDVRYRKMNYQNSIAGSVDYNRSWHIEQYMNKKSPFRICRSYFQTVNEGIDYIYQSIEAGNPVCVGMNPYHVTYSKDYHTLYGGLFKTYHMLIIKGYDRKKEEFYVVDPALDVAQGMITHSDLIAGWNEPKGMRSNYIPYTYYKFAPKEMRDFISIDYECMSEAALDNFRTYYDTSIINILGDDYYQGRTAIQNMIDDLKKLDFSENNRKISIETLNNIHYGIFHGIRWIRKSFYLFLNSNVKYDDYQYQNTKEEFGTLFDRWSDVGMKLSYLIQSTQFNKISKVADEITDLFENEQKIVGDLITELKSIDLSKEKTL